MENPETILCRLCLAAISCEDSKLIDAYDRDILDIVLPKLDLNKDKHLMCNGCSTKLFAAFDFKVMCINTEDCIFPYVDVEGGPLDLKEICLKESGCKRPNKVTDQRICRLCIGSISNEVELLEVDRKAVDRCIPEVNFGSTKDPAVCGTCHISLGTHSIFLKMLLDTDEKIRSLGGKDNKGNSEVTCPIGSNINLSSKQDVQSNARRKKNISRSAISDKNTKRSIIQTEPQNKAMLQCDRCNYKTPKRRLLLTHMAKHIKRATGRFQCDLCSYETRYKLSLVSHQFIHKVSSDTQVHKCNSCEFESIYKTHYMKHRELHSLESKFKCLECSYETNSRSRFTTHKASHEEIPYRCQECPYASKNQRLFKAHRVGHEDPSLSYGCNKCNYRCNKWRNLSQHRRVHKKLA